MVVVEFPQHYLRLRRHAELLDQPGHAREVLAENLRDLARVNRWLGGNWLTLHALERVLAEPAAIQRVPPGEYRVLDVGSGGADMPAAMFAWGRARGIRIRPFALDLSPEILDVARQRQGAWADFLVADGCHLPFADASFDVAACSLVLHHLGPKNAIALLREMARVARGGIIVNDLVRSGPGYVGAWLFSRMTTRNQLTRHDAPLSAQRAYTWREMRRLLELADLRPTHRMLLPFYRVAFVARARS